MKRRMLIFKKSAKLLTAIVIAGQVLAQNPNWNIFTELTGTFAPLTVEAAWNDGTLPNGNIRVIQNAVGAPAPHFVQNADGTYSLTMYKGMLIELETYGSNNIYKPIPLQVCTFAELAPTDDGSGIYINATDIGTQQIQIQMTNTKEGTTFINNTPEPVGYTHGNPFTLNLTVLDLATTSYVTLEQAKAVGSHAGVLNGYYSYADDHKVVSTDGNLELDLDEMKWSTMTSNPLPVVYYAADGILTVECYDGQGISIYTTSHLDDYEVQTSGNMIGIWGERNIGEIIECHSIQNRNSGSRFNPYTQSPTTKLPIRVITLGSWARGLGGTEYGTLYLTKK